MASARKANEFAGTVDFGVLTVREDEMEPLVRRCGEKALRDYIVTGRQSYILFDIVLGKERDLIYRLALVRSIRQGAGEAQRRASNMIEDFDPHWLMLVGIAGATPSDEFTLGDVVVATELHAFSVRAAVHGKGTEYRPGGGPMSPEVEDFIALLSARQDELGDWNETIGWTSPPVDVKDPGATYGDEAWQNKVRNEISKHFPTASSTRKPKITTRSFVGGNTLIKDDALWREWQSHARQVETVEMELEGVYTAARTLRRTYPILVSKGISDIVGFNRDPSWTKYACETAAAGALAMLALRPVEPLEKPDLHAHDGTKKKTKPTEEAVTNIEQSSQRTLAKVRGGLIHEFSFKRNQIIANVHDEYSLGLDSTLRTAWISLNALRERRGLRPHFASTRFRLICEPRFAADQIELDLAPIDFVYPAMLEEESVGDSVKEHIRTRIQETARRFPSRLQSIHPTINGLNHHPLGVEIAIITKDGKTLLRRRGRNVLLARSEWDVSFSGYCGEKDRIGAEGLEISLTAQHELQREIGVLTADPRDIVFTGLHRNAVTGAVDVLGVWPIESRTDELVDLLADKYPGLFRAFKTTKKAEEDFVWDTSNIIVEFDGSTISQAIKEMSAEEGRTASFMTEAFVCLLLGLEATGNSTAELAVHLQE